MTRQTAAQSAASKSPDGLGLDEAYAVEGPDANRELYASWAATYESEFIVESRYVYHQQVAEVFCAGMAAFDRPVLDAGCGTGIVGDELARLGVTVIDGIDISTEMLAKAGTKTHDSRPTYRQLVEADLTGRIDLADESYDGIVSAGTFTHGHLGPDTISELLRVARTGAHCALGINSAHFDESGFGDWLEQCRADGHITELHYELRPIYGGADEADPNQWARIAVFAVR
ncbi:class I SAM-dependent DNA methyltransferase [Candidatus Poriferisodalis sp.]|uniref:class I SAM-dependent DNA methyltransferase n=1 Tax=Candidatus Poriferisodalis sp. TaxID=3101277 RepID=UPI003C6F9918